MSSTPTRTDPPCHQRRTSSVWGRPPNWGEPLPHGPPGTAATLSRPLRQAAAGRVGDGRGRRVEHPDGCPQQRRTVDLGIGGGHRAGRSVRQHRVGTIRSNARRLRRSIPSESRVWSSSSAMATVPMLRWPLAPWPARSNCHTGTSTSPRSRCSAGRDHAPRRVQGGGRTNGLETVPHHRGPPRRASRCRIPGSRTLVGPRRSPARRRRSRRRVRHYLNRTIIDALVDRFGRHGRTRSPPARCTTSSYLWRCAASSRPRDPCAGRLTPSLPTIRGSCSPRHRRRHIRPPGARGLRLVLRDAIRELTASSSNEPPNCAAFVIAAGNVAARTSCRPRRRRADGLVAHSARRIATRSRCSTTGRARTASSHCRTSCSGITRWCTSRVTVRTSPTIRPPPATCSTGVRC